MFTEPRRLPSIAMTLSVLCLFFVALLEAITTSSSTDGPSFLRKLQGSIADDVLDAIQDGFADGDIPSDETKDDNPLIVGTDFVEDISEFPTVPPTSPPGRGGGGNNDLETWALALIIAGGGALVLALIGVAYYNLRKAESEQEVDEDEQGGVSSSKRGGLATQGIDDDSDEVEEEEIVVEEDSEVGNTQFASNDYNSGTGYRSSSSDGLGQFQTSTGATDPDGYGDDDSEKVSM